MKPMELNIVNEEGKYKLALDGKEMHHVMEYKIESLQRGNYAELSIKMIVQFPVTRENDL